MGHAFNKPSWIPIRYQRMQGKAYPAWQVGTITLGSTTQMVVERKIMPLKEGKTRHDYGRDAFIDKIWQWKAESGGTITGECAVSATPLAGARALHHGRRSFQCRERDVCRLYKKTLIYRGKRTVNWDPKLRTAISDWKWKTASPKGSMWHIRYPLADGAKTADGKDYWSRRHHQVETILGDAPAWP